MSRVAQERVLPSEAARLVGCSPQWIRYLVDAGRLAGERGPGGIRLISRVSVGEFAKERARGLKRQPRQR